MPTKAVHSITCLSPDHVQAAVRKVQRFGLGFIYRRRALKRRAARVRDQVVAFVTSFLEQVTRLGYASSRRSRFIIQERPTLFKVLGPERLSTLEFSERVYNNSGHCPIPRLKSEARRHITS